MDSGAQRELTHQELKDRVCLQMHILLCFKFPEFWCIFMTYIYCFSIYLLNMFHKSIAKVKSKLPIETHNEKEIYEMFGRGCVVV